MGVPSIPRGGFNVTISLRDETVTQHCRVLEPTPLTLSLVRTSYEETPR